MLILGTCPAQRFNWLGPVEVRSVSNGGLIVGKMVDMNGQTRALRRMRLRGNEPQPTLGGAHSEAWGITHNGRVLVGFATDSNGRVRAYRQTPNELQDLGVLDSGMPYAWSEARDVAQDGAVVVGASIAANGFLHAFRWTPTGQMQDLGTLGGANSRAFGVSADGLVVVGAADNAQGQWRPFRWTASGGMQELGTFGGATGDAWAASADGSVVVGAAHNAQGQWRAFRWTQAAGLQELGTLGGEESGARDISADGKVIVGLAKNPQGQWRAFRWTQATGLQDLTQTYAALIGTGSYLEVAQSISPNGRFIVGAGYNAATGRNEAYILETEPPRPGRILSIGVRPLSMSWDGRTVAGTTGYFFDEPFAEGILDGAVPLHDAFRWTPTEGLQRIAQTAIALDVSASGRFIVGARWDGRRLKAFVWTRESGLQDLPDPSGPRILYITDTVATAVADYGGDGIQPFVLGNARGYYQFTGSFCPSSGNTLQIAWQGVTNPWTLFEWCFPFFYITDVENPFGSAGSMVGFSRVVNGEAFWSNSRLPTFPSWAWATTYGVVVGTSNGVAVRWWLDHWWTPYWLPRLPGCYGNSCAYGVSGDARVIVGAFSDGYWVSNFLPSAWRYTDEDGIEDLTDTYMHLLGGYELIEARAISWDGRFIACWADNNIDDLRGIWLDTWREGDVNGDGCVDDADLLAVLFAFGTEGLIRTPTHYASYLLRHEDINYDGIVDDADLLMVLFNFGSGC